MAGTTAVEVPVTAAIVNESPRMKVQGSPEKSPHVLKMDSGEVKTSPQGKGVGIFGLEGSPTIITQVDGPAKDPKVSMWCQIWGQPHSHCRSPSWISSFTFPLMAVNSNPGLTITSRHQAIPVQVVHASGHIPECLDITSTHSFVVIQLFDNIMVYIEMCSLTVQM